MVVFGSKLIVTLKTAPVDVVELNEPASLVIVTLLPLLRVTVMTCVVAVDGDRTGETLKASGVGGIQTTVGVMVAVGVFVATGVMVTNDVNMKSFGLPKETPFVKLAYPPVAAATRLCVWQP